MKTIMAKNPHDSFSFSRRYFNFRKKVEDEDDDIEEILNFSSSSDDKEINFPRIPTRSLSDASSKQPKKKSHSIVAFSKIRSAFSIGKSKTNLSFVGTLFGYRRGHVHFAFQEDFKLCPAFLVELATPTSVLVKEMASGLVRIALECDKKSEKKGLKILQEPLWRTYCNGKKCGYAMRRECGPDEWKILNSIGPISMGAGVLPGVELEGELMYMRAKFERVVGSKDSEAFYMMNPDGHGGPELSIYLLRV